MRNPWIDTTLLAVGWMVISLPTRVAAQVACGAELGPGGSLTLTADLGPCDDPDPALTIVGPFKLKMDGHRIFCENLNDDETLSDGVVVLGEAAVVKKGSVVGCRDGIALAGSGGHTINEMAVLDSARNGVAIESSGNLVKRSAIMGSAESGARISGGSNRVEDTFGVGNGVGFEIDGETNLLARNIAVQSAEQGFLVRGATHRLEWNVAANNHEEAFEVDGSGHELESNVAIGSESPSALFVRGDDMVLKDNRSVANLSTGFQIQGSRNEIQKNFAVAEGNTGMVPFRGTGTNPRDNLLRKNRVFFALLDGIRVAAEETTVQKNVVLENGTDLRDSFPDCDGNVWENNTFKTSSVDGGPNPGCIE